MSRLTRFSVENQSPLIKIHKFHTHTHTQRERKTKSSTYASSYRGGIRITLIALSPLLESGKDLQNLTKWNERMEEAKDKGGRDLVEYRGLNQNGIIYLRCYNAWTRWHKTETRLICTYTRIHTHTHTRITWGNDRDMRNSYG